ncbi:MAG: hypothetical protein DPW16_22320 [Chloroflexi bacterium]|nr:hypothetical protein [Chloroflexota bacterium]
MKPSPRFFRLLVIMTLATLVGFGLSAWRLSQGDANPAHQGSLQWADEEFLWAGGSDEQIILPADTLFYDAPYLLKNAFFTLEVSAQINQAADPFTAWGIALANNNGTWTMIGINGAGYVTARQCPQAMIPHLDSCPPLTEPTQQISTYWKPFRFIRRRGATNTIRLDFSPTHKQLTLRLNREWMWDLPYRPTDQGVLWGVWIQGGPDSWSSFTWDKTRVWSNK